MVTYFKIISTVGKVVLPSLLWNFNIKEKYIYLTFDDGPIPVVTPWVLQQLKKYNAKATFFCIGENVTRNPQIFNEILREGHVTGNHTHNHLDGWRTGKTRYVDNVLNAESSIQAFIKSKHNSQPAKKLFRPPYGRIKPSQIKDLERHGYKIVMWDVISGDYDQHLSPYNCIQNITGFSKPGSIVVMHDSVKAFQNLQKVLPQILRHYSEEGYEFKCL